MGGRVSEWEARAMRKSDQEQEAQARAQGQQTRTRIQDEAGRGSKRRNAEIRQVERGRQWDRQREEIHPAEVLERLASIEEKKPAPTKLPPAVRDTDPDRPVRPLRKGSHRSRTITLQSPPRPVPGRCWAWNHDPAAGNPGPAGNHVVAIPPSHGQIRAVLSDYRTHLGRSARDPGDPGNRISGTAPPTELAPMVRNHLYLAHAIAS